MIQLTLVRKLLTSAPPEEGRASHVSAASGAVYVNGALYVVADDEQCLARFADGAAKGEWQRLFPGELPLDPKLRKAMKADLETLAEIRVGERQGLIALGSGSTTRRDRGAFVAFDAEGRTGFAQRLDLKPLYDALRAKVGELNIEGSALMGGEFVLLQRGNAKGMGNAIIRLRADGVSDAIAKKAALGAELILSVQPVSLPAINGVPLGFTDAIAIDDARFAFSAVAEATDNAYDDGAFSGAAIGAMTLEGQLLGLEEISPSAKIEGLARRGDRLFLVTDDDEPLAAAALYETAFPAFIRP